MYSVCLSKLCWGDCSALFALHDPGFQVKLPSECQYYGKEGNKGMVIVSWFLKISSSKLVKLLPLHTIGQSKSLSPTNFNGAGCTRYHVHGRRDRRTFEDANRCGTSGFLWYESLTFTVIVI